MPRHARKHELAVEIAPVWIRPEESRVILWLYLRVFFLCFPLLGVFSLVRFRSVVPPSSEHRREERDNTRVEIFVEE
jgi:hypothetical protein